MVQKFLNIEEKVEMMYESEAAAKASSPTDIPTNCKNTVLHPFDHQVIHLFVTYIYL